MEKIECSDIINAFTEATEKESTKRGTRRPPPYLGRAAQRLIPPVEVTSWVCTSHHLALINNRNCGGQGCCNHRDTETITVLGRAVNRWFICCSSQSNVLHISKSEIFVSASCRANNLAVQIKSSSSCRKLHDWCRPIALEQWYTFFFHVSRM